MEEAGVESLSAQQRRCLRLVGRGYGSGEIARELGIAESTVNGHLSIAVAKLKAPNRRRAAALLADHEAETSDPQKLPGQNLRLDPLALVAPPPTPYSVRDIEFYPSDDGYDPRLPAEASPLGETRHDQLGHPFKTIAIILLIAAAFVFILSHYQSLIGIADDLYNALPPTSIKAK